MGTKKRSYNLSDEERQRRSELARQLHSTVIDPESGRRAFGGRQPGAGRPRKPRAAEVVAEEARKAAQDIVTALKDALEPTQPISVRVNAATKWLEIENKEASLQLAEDKEFHTMSEEELASLVAQSFMRINGRGALDALLAENTGEIIVNGEIVEDDDDEAD